jgi:hypothetical protein
MCSLPNQLVCRLPASVPTTATESQTTDLKSLKRRKAPGYGVRRLFQMGKTFRTSRLPIRYSRQMPGQGRDARPVGVNRPSLPGLLLDCGSIFSGSGVYGKYATVARHSQ